MTETIKISSLPSAGVLDGTERVPVVKNGVTRITTTQQIGNLFSGAGLGTVTSVGLTAPDILSVGGSPVTTAGDLTLSLVAQDQNVFFAGPASGGAGLPSFRSIDTADLSGVVLGVAQGGTGTTTATGTAGSVVLSIGPSLVTPEASSSSASTPALRLRNTADSSNVTGLVVEGDRGTPTNNDNVHIAMRLSDGAGAQTEFGRISTYATSVSDGAEEGEIRLGVVGSGTLANRATLSSTAWSPNVTGGLGLGTTSRMWSGLFMAPDSAINWNNGNVTLTHVAGYLTLAGGVLVLPSSGLQIGASNPFSDAAGTLTLQNVDALDETTGNTVEASIVDLPNLATVQGSVVSLGGSLTTAGATTVSGFGASLVDDANAAAGRTTLGVAIGVDVQAWSASLDAIAALSSTGLAARTGLNTWAERTITGTANEVSVANGDGVSGNPTLSLPSTLSFSGKTISGGTFSSPTAITGLPDPTNAQDAATKGYVDSVAEGLSVKDSVVVATASNITLSGEQTIDGVLTSASRVLVKAQSLGEENGIYVSGAGAWTRSTDFDAWSEVPSAFVFVEEGATFGGSGWVCTNVAGGTIGVTPITFSQFSSSSSYSADGTTLQLVGTVFSVANAELLAIASLTSAANKLPYFTGSGTAAVTDLSAFGRSLIDDASDSDARTTLGVAIGVDVQAYSAALASWSAVTRAAGFDTFAATPSSANLRSLLTDETGTGAAVFATSPTLVTPILGTPTSGTLTNCTGLPISTGVSGLATGVATFLGTPSSANLKAAVTDETGSGALVFATSPTLVTPAIGTPSSGTLTNCTGLPIATGVSGLGTGVATFLATPSSANLAAAVTGETGSGALVFATSPTLVTPLLGTPTSGTLTNCTGLPISTGVSGLGANVATFLATPSSSNLLAAVTDETGSGALVFATAPALVQATSSSVTATTAPLTLTATSGSTDVPVLRLDGDKSSPAANDTAYIDMRLSDSAGNQTTFARMDWRGTSITDGAEEALMIWRLVQAGTLTGKLVLQTTTLNPFVNDALALGSTTHQWSDLFLASGGVIGWNSNDVTITHSANALAFAGASSGYTFDAALSIGTSATLTAGTIELGHASDTTFSRRAAGYGAIEGKEIQTDISLAYDDSTDDAAALQTALDNANGRVIKLRPGSTIRLATAISTTGKSWVLDARGANIHVDANVAAITAYPGTSQLQNVSAVSGAVVTVADGGQYSVGDWIRVISDDVPLDAETQVSGSNIQSLGEPNRILSISGNDLTCERDFYYASQFVTTVRCFKIGTPSVHIIGGHWYFTQGQAWTNPMFQIIGMIHPRIEGVRISRGYAQGIKLVGTISAVIDTVHIGGLNATVGTIGYGISDNGYYTTVLNATGAYGRDLFTTSNSAVAPGATGEASLHGHGHSVGCQVIGARGVGFANSCVDTHHTTRDATFRDIYAEDTAYAVTVRGKNMRIDGVNGHNVGSMVYVFTEAYNPPTSDGVADEDGWTSDVFVSNVFGNTNGRFLEVVKAQRVVYGGVMRGSCKRIDAIRIRDATVECAADIDITINDTAGTDGVIGMIDVLQSGTLGSTFDPIFKQMPGSRIRLDATGSTNSTGFQIVRSGQASYVTLDGEVDAILPPSSVGPIFVSWDSPAGVLTARHITYDVAGGGESGVTLSSGTVSVNAFSADGSNDRTDVLPRRHQRFESVRLNDSDDSHWLALLAGSNLTANRSLTINTGDADRTLDISAGSITLAAGTYTPTLFNTTNVSSSTAYLCHYSRVGNTVTVSGRVDVTPTAAASTATTLGVSLPIASNFSNAVQCTGSAAASNIVSVAAGIAGSSGSDRAIVIWLSSSTSAHEMYFTFTYQVI